MGRAEIERFAADLKMDAALQQAAKNKAADVARLVEAARAQGYDITLDDVRAHLRAQRHDLSDQELEAIAGGATGMMGINMFGTSKT